MRLHDGSYAVPLFGEWWRHTEDDLARMRAAGHTAHVEAVLQRDYEQYENGLSVFLPHGLPWSAVERSYDHGSIVIPPSTYPQKWKNDGVAFINDRQSDYVFLVAPRKTGKSSHGAAALGYRVLDCDKNWPCFTEHGIEHIPFTGPKVLTIASFSWDNVADLWKVYQEVWPRDELGDYAKGGKKNLTFKDGKTKIIETKKSGTELRFLCYGQMQAAWENLKCHYHHADEQEPLVKLSALEDGQRTMGRTQVFFTLSGFVLPDRPDTGEAGELKRGIYDGKRSRGRVIGRYHIDIPSTPDAIIDQDSKKKIYDQYVNPALQRTKKEERRAKAVYYPGWEPRGSMVFDADCWDRAVHVVNPWWPEGETPQGLTLWRSVDYGSAKGTNVCSWWAVGPLKLLLSRKPELLAAVPVKRHGEIYGCLYRLLYETGLEIPDLSREMVTRSGNTRAVCSEIRDSESGNTYAYWREERKAEAYWGGTLLDPRSAAQRQQGQTLEEIFSRYGINDVRPACGDKDMIQIPRLKDWLRIDWTVAHPFRKNADGTPMMGCPRLFFFDGRTKAAVDEIEGLRKADDKTLDVSPNTYINKGDPHHFVDTAKYWASDNPRYMGNREPSVDASEPDRGTPFTGA
jgi:hypothetical protein